MRQFALERQVQTSACEIFHKEVLRSIFASDLVGIAVFRPVLSLALAIVFPMLIISGCEKRVSADNVEILNRQQIQAQKRVKRVEGVAEGLTMKEVEAVIGAPTAVVNGKVQREVVKEFDFVTWTYEQDGQTIELSFVDGKLQGPVPKFGEKLDPKAPLLMNKEAQK